MCIGTCNHPEGIVGERVVNDNLFDRGPLHSMLQMMSIVFRICPWTILMIQQWMLCREYMATRIERWEEEETFKIMFCRCHPFVAVQYLVELHDFPCFSSWLIMQVRNQWQAGKYMDDDVVQSAQSPEMYAISHCKMYAFSMHFHVCSAKGGLVTRDLCVAVSFTWQVPWGLQNGQPVKTIKEYVGYIEEILELDYQKHCTTVLMCDWVCSSQGPRWLMSTTWMERCTQTLLHFHCIVKKVLSPMIQRGRARRLYVNGREG